MSLLIDAGILPSDKRSAFEQMVKLRNRIVHLYEEVDPQFVFSILVGELDDFEAFISAIVKSCYSA